MREFCLHGVDKAAATQIGLSSAMPHSAEVLGQTAAGGEGVEREGFSGERSGAMDPQGSLKTKMESRREAHL